MVDTKEQAYYAREGMHFGTEFAWMIAKEVDNLTMAKKMRLFGTYDVFSLPFKQVRRTLLKDISKEEGDWR